MSRVRNKNTAKISANNRYRSLGIRNLIPSLGFLIVLMATNEDAVALGINGISLEHRLSREYFKIPYLRKILFNPCSKIITHHTDLGNENIYSFLPVYG